MLPEIEIAARAFDHDNAAKAIDPSKTYQAGDYAHDETKAALDGDLIVQTRSRAP